MSPEEIEEYMAYVSLVHELDQFQPVSSEHWMTLAPGQHNQAMRELRGRVGQKRLVDEHDAKEGKTRHEETHGMVW